VKRPSALFVVVRESESRVGPREPEALAFTRGSQGLRGAITGGFRQRLASARRRRRPHCTRLSLWCAVIARHEVSERIGFGAKLSSRMLGLETGAASSGSRVSYAGGARREVLGGESRPAPDPVKPRLVERDVSDGASAPTGAHPRGAVRLSEMGNVERHHPDPVSAWRMASNPSGGLLPTQRKLGASRRRAWNGDRSILRLCSWVVLVAEVDERHFGPSQLHDGQPPRKALGLAYRPRASCACSACERVSEAGSRRAKP